MRQPKLPKTSHLGKDKNGQVSVRRIIAPEDMEAYRKPRIISPVPPGMMSVRDVIDLFAGAKLPLTDNKVREWFTDGQNCPKGKVRCVCTWKGKPTVILRQGFHIPVLKVKRKWAEKFPGRPWPLPQSGQPDLERQDNQSERQKKGRGRPRGRKKEKVDRDKEMLAAWGRGEFESKAAAALAYNVDASYARRILPTRKVKT
jgi:hypothetical protein